MQFHLPKPLHGWRAFAGEVGVIVLGVLIALGAGQLAEDLNWRSKANDAQKEIDAELAQIGGIFDVRGMVAQCNNQTLSQASAIISKARASGELPDVKQIRGGSTAPLVTTAWESALSEGTVSHIEEGRRRQYAAFYNTIGLYRDGIKEEGRLYSHLRLLERNPGRISDVLLADISIAAAELGTRMQLNNIIAEQGLLGLKRIGIQPRYGYFTGAPGTIGNGPRKEVLEDVKAAGRMFPSCTPITANGEPVSAENASS